MKKNSFQLPLFIAKRYIFSKKKHNVINIISIIAGLGVFASAAALVIVLSVFNGMAQLVESNFNRFNPDIKITPREGKSFLVDSFPLAALHEIDGVLSVQEVVSDLTLITCKDRQILTEIKGVSNEYTKIAQLDSLAVMGNFSLNPEGEEVAVLGAISASQLLLYFNEVEYLKFHYPNRTQKNLTNPSTAFQTQFLPIGGVFQSNTDYDGKVVFVPIAFARDLCNYHHEVTSIELFIEENAKLAAIQKEVKALLGTRYLVQNSYEQEEIIFRAIAIEKLMVFIILGFIILIAAFNIVGIIGMMLVEKKRDIEILATLGGNERLIRRVFAFHGLLVSIMGGFGGLCLGYLICFLQETFDIIQIRGYENDILATYPVEMNLWDGVLIFILVLTVSMIASFLSVYKLQNNKKQ